MWRAAMLSAAFILTAFHLGLIFSGLVPNLVARPLHLALILPWIFIFTEDRPRGILGWGGVVLALLGIAGSVWIALNAGPLADQYGFVETGFQYAVGGVLLLAVLEAARRAIGWPLPLIAALALAYAAFGQHVPGEFGHAPLPAASLMGTLTLAEGGIFGSLTGVSVGVVAIFVIFGAVLNAGEAGQGFMNLAAAVAGRLRGGAGKVSVIASALFGSISGSASANVASTGAITIPAMIRLGYPRRIAGAVEAVASSGGQIMPPLMGAGAFVMVELTGTPYTQIIGAAILPAILYFVVVWVGIDAYARRFGLGALPADQRPGGAEVAVTSAFFAVPFAVLLGGMFGLGFTPQYSAALAIIAGAVLLIAGADMRIDLRRAASRFEAALIASARQVALIASIILCASIIVGVLAITGLGVKVTSLILSTSNGTIWPSLLLTALACLVLGMEVPTTAAYVICISVAGPALTQLGLAPLQAHLFVFWFALLSTITPPVCGAVFIAAGMARENWLRVAITAMALGVGLYLIPLGMVAHPSLIRLASEPLAALLAAVIVGGGCVIISYALIGAQRVLPTVIGIAAGLALIFGFAASY
ncbi:TRAP transporter fused permease subunit [Paracoccus sp. 1_MG-2023]|nr:MULTISPECIES: TRAP transporter fused permease subunit [unclassified Paracoccus (in: a-proteobacteria)]MBU2958490.1 TRAP transporter fused permease subunit [Paracoccus sp. C2R09]MDO6668525.1 TRAP transporter fused permease subunit [Paracoccus sp. 1_MG-2023]